MDEMIKDIMYVFLFPGFVFTCTVGLFFCWVDRKIAARIQSRVGPPWYQCYVDILKLMGKEMVLPIGSRRVGFLLAPLIGLAGVTLVSTIIWRVNINPKVSFVGDLIVVYYLWIMPSLALILGGSSSGNPFGTIGASREMKMILAYELPFLLVILTVIIKIKSILLGDLIQFQSLHGFLIRNPSCMIAFFVSLPCIQAKLSYLPFDIPEAETEIIGGTIAEYSGSALALFKLTNAMMLFSLPYFLITLFFGGIHFSVKGIIIALAEFMVIFLFISFIKTTHPRLRIDQAIKFFWWFLTPIAIIGAFLALLGV